jgi:DNA-directed RNA polymerase subunit omega
MIKNIDELLKKVDSKYTLVILGAKRARQISNYLNSVGKSELDKAKGPSISDISKKPLSIAFSEIAEDKVAYKRNSDGIK